MHMWSMISCSHSNMSWKDFESFSQELDCCREGSWKVFWHRYSNRQLHRRWDGEDAVGNTQRAAGQETCEKPKQKRKHLHWNTVQHFSLCTYWLWIRGSCTTLALFRNFLKLRSSLQAVSEWQPAQGNVSLCVDAKMIFCFFFHIHFI